jgi:queuine/archaeosine tRNA-ribosyltransferase
MPLSTPNVRWRQTQSIQRTYRWYTACREYEKPDSAVYKIVFTINPLKKMRICFI